jgi:hypothetical protein
MPSSEECDDELLYEAILPDDFFLDITFDLDEGIVDMGECRIQNRDS